MRGLKLQWRLDGVKGDGRTLTSAWIETYVAIINKMCCRTLTSAWIETFRRRFNAVKNMSHSHECVD